MTGYKNITASTQLKTLPGRLCGVFISSASGSPTIKITDGVGGTPAAAVKATQVLTASTIADGETVTIGTAGVNSRTYTFKTTLSGAAFEVLIGASDATALDNLKSAINATAGAGTTYGTGTTAHPEVSATTNTDTQQTVEALQAGTAGNAIATTTTCAASTWGAAVLAGGLQAVELVVDTFTPVAGTYYKFGDENGISIKNALYVTVGATVSANFFFD